MPISGGGGEVIARPKGSVLETGSVLTDADEWRTVVGTEHTPPADYWFMLAKILVSCPSDVLYRLRWDGTVISAAQVFITGGIPFTDWFPWDYYTMLGDGEKEFDIQVRAPTADDEDTCYAEIIGENAK